MMQQVPIARRGKALVETELGGYGMNEATSRIISHLSLAILLATNALVCEERKGQGRITQESYTGSIPTDELVQLFPWQLL